MTHATLASVTVEQWLVGNRLGWVCTICRTLFVGSPREGFVCCPSCLSDLNRREK